MTTTLTLDLQMNRFGFWSAVIAIVTGMISFFLPLDAPGGYTADHADRIAWLTANRDLFILGWLNQIAAMLSLSGVFFAIAWHIAIKNPLRAALAAMVVLLSVVAFIIPKFMAIWTIPQLAEVITSNAVGAELADTLLLLLNVSVPFSLYTSFDYLGFCFMACLACWWQAPFMETKQVQRLRPSRSECLASFTTAYWPAYCLAASHPLILNLPSSLLRVCCWSQWW